MKAIVAKRVETGIADLEEINHLATSAGYEVVGKVTQTRQEDSTFGLGEGKIREIAALVADTNADTVIVDNRLGPYQTYNIGLELPDDVSVIDRFRLILEIFAQRAHSRKAQLQVELAELRYELPRASAKASLAQRDEHPGFMGLGEYGETRERDIKARISRVREELDGMATDDASWRKDRREAGFELVALAGYTNAGKSTLLRRLATDLDVDENESLHPDLDPTAESQDQLFTTLGTTTRRADVDGRNVLVTDTVGFISNLPHWLVESFRSTLEQVYHADLVLLVVDSSDPIDVMREKIVTSHDTLYDRNEAPILTVFNKVDTITDAELEARLDALSDLAPRAIPVSAETGNGTDTLRERIHDTLPTLTEERLLLPLTEDTMSVVSWLHDHASVHEVDYMEDEVLIEFAGHEPIIAKSREKTSELTPAQHQ